MSGMVVDTTAVRGYIEHGFNLVLSWIKFTLVYNITFVLGQLFYSEWPLDVCSQLTVFPVASHLMYFRPEIKIYVFVPASPQSRKGPYVENFSKGDVLLRLLVNAGNL